MQNLTAQSGMGRGTQARKRATEVVRAPALPPPEATIFKDAPDNSGRVSNLK